VIEKSLAGPIGIFIKFSTLQDYGVDKVFFLENGNADSSQRNVVFIARGESGKHAKSIAGMYILAHLSRYTFISSNPSRKMGRCLLARQTLSLAPMFP
jgi:hypothetical protein